MRFRTPLLCFCLLLAVFLVLSISASSQISLDPQIMAEVNQIRAVDNHTHVPKVVGTGEKDDDFDALPCDPLEPTEAPLMARPENPKFLEAWQKLYGYKYSDIWAAGSIRRVSSGFRLMMR